MRRLLPVPTAETMRASCARWRWGVCTARAAASQARWLIRARKRERGRCSRLPRAQAAPGGRKPAWRCSRIAGRPTDSRPCSWRWAAYAGTGGLAAEGRIDAPQWLYLDGWLTPVEGRCVLKSDGWAIRIESDLESVTYLASHAIIGCRKERPKGLGRHMRLAAWRHAT